MSPEQKAAFRNLLAAEKAYVEGHASEVDQGGTIRTMRTIGSEEIIDDVFHTELVQFERKEWPKLSDDQIKTASVSLDREYAATLKRLRSRKPEDVYEGAVTAGGVASVEISWKAYRDAWVAFARVRYPSDVDAIEAKITLDRYRLLKTIS
jgi:hypothetical protein